MAEFLCNQLNQHLILMDGAAIYALVKCTYLPTKTLPSSEATRLQPGSRPPYAGMLIPHAAIILRYFFQPCRLTSANRAVAGAGRHCLLSNLRQKKFLPVSRIRAQAKTCTVIQSKAKTFMRSARPQASHHGQ